ncbi:hypothetical protein GEMRC1_006768 [Eukaryota sp. GEM-RC1]
MMKHVLAIAMLIILAYAGCRCPSTCGTGYHGSRADCYCFCQRQAYFLRVSPNARCTHYAKAQFVPGGCSLCDSTINNTAYETSTTEIFEKGLSDAFLGITVNDEMIFPLRQCKCHDIDCKEVFLAPTTSALLGLKPTLPVS